MSVPTESSYADLKRVPEEGDYVRIVDTYCPHHGRTGIVTRVADTEDVRGAIVRLDQIGREVGTAAVVGFHQIVPSGVKRDDTGAIPVPKSRAPEYGEGYLVQVVRYDGGMSSYENAPRWDCLTCGAVVSDRNAHDRWHDLLVRQACRG